MKGRTKRGAIVLSLSMLATWVLAEDIPLKNWAAPVWWSPTRGHGLTTLSETNPLSFIALSPCRILDTRGNGAPIQGGRFTGGSDVRSYTLPGICGLPSSIAAVSLNFTVVGPDSAGFMVAWATGAPVPPVSIMNFVASQVLANAAIVPTSSSGSITVNVSTATDLLMDVNGYFPNTTTMNPLAAGEFFGIVGSVAGGGTIAATNGSNLTASSGVSGTETATTGTTYGVLGKISSTTLDSAGVRGVEGAGSAAGMFAASALRGESSDGLGTLGISIQPNGVAGAAGVLLNSSGSTIAEGRLGFSTLGTNYGVYANTGNIGATGTKQFIVPHPSDPSMVIRYVSLEGPEAGTYFRGRAKLEGRTTVIDVPESFRLVTEEDGLSVQVTPLGGPASLWIQEIGLDRIVIRGQRDLEFFYTVNGVRKGYGGFEPLSQGSEFVPESPSSRLPEGLNPETKRRLIANGTYNPDGTVNMETAERMGWTKIWAAGSPVSR